MQLPDLVWPSEDYPLLVFQLGSDESEGRSPMANKRDFGILGHLVKGVGAQLAFFSIPLIPEVNTEWNRKTGLSTTRFRG